MAQIYLTGAISEGDDPFAWHDELAESDEWSDHEFVNPYTLNDFEMGDTDIYDRPHEVVEPALSEIEESDGVLVKWQDDIFLVGSAMEIKHAWENGVPVIVWYDGWKDNLSPWLLETTKGNFADRDKALKVLLTFAGDKFAIKESF